MICEHEFYMYFFLSSYEYILPLVKEIHLLELKVKEKHEEYKQNLMEKDIYETDNTFLAGNFKSNYYFIFHLS